MTNENEFGKWFMKNWEKTQGLICQADAAALLGIKPQSITSRINSGSITTYEYIGIINNKKTKKTYLSLNEIALEKIKKG